MNNVKSITPNAPADFTPAMGNYKDLQPFRYWCNKILPMVYDDSLSYYELLCKVVDYLNKTMEDVETLHGDVTNIRTAYDELQGYVNDYFSTLDVQEEINNKLDNMASSGELYEIIRKYTDPIVNEQNDKINVLTARMDTFASLPDGSTTGDAELADIRVGYNGIIYPSAGDAVREQVSELNEDLFSIGDNLFGEILAMNGQFDYGGYIGSIEYNTSGNWGKCKTVKDLLYSCDKDITIELNNPTNKTLSAYLSAVDTDGNYLGMIPSDKPLPITNNKITITSNYMKSVYANAKRTYITICCVNNNVYDVVPNEIEITIYSGEKTFENLIKYADTLYTDNFPFNDLNDVDKNKLYQILLPSIPTNAPNDFKINEYYYLFTTEMIFRFNNTLHGTQYLFSRDLSEIWCRNHDNGVFTPWLKVKEKEIVVSKDGSGDYTEILPALLEAVQNKNSKVYVKDGIYNVYDEFINTYGSDFFDNFTYTYNGNVGYRLYNGVHVIFDNRAKVVFNYDGSNANVYKFFAPFNMQYGDAILENATIEAKNCRYCVHDDIGGYLSPYKHIYKNCTMILDNISNPHWNATQCIGGGFGQNGTIEIDGCRFTSNGLNDERGYGLVSWHNTGEANGKSSVIIKNSYFSNDGTAWCQPYGLSELVSVFTVCNNRLGKPPYLLNHPDYPNNNNVKLVAFNNEIAN